MFSGFEREGSAVVGGEKTGNGALVSPGHPFTLLVLDWAHGVSRPGSKSNPRRPRPGLQAAGNEGWKLRDGAGLACAREGGGP